MCTASLAAASNSSPRTRIEGSVAGGAQDCPYTYMRDLAVGKYRLPWEDEVHVTDGTSCGFAIPNRTYAG